MSLQNVGVAVRAPTKEKAKAGVLRRMLALDDFDLAARGILPRPIYGFVAGGAETGSTLAANRRAFSQYALVPRVLVDTSNRRIDSEVFGLPCAAPFGIAPMGAAGLAAHLGDIVLARAAEEMRIPFILSASSMVPLEKVRMANKSAWFQAYLPGEPGRIVPLVERVKSAGFEVFVITVDLPVTGNRENNIRNGFSLPLKPSLRLAWDGLTRPRWLLGTAFRTLLNSGMPHFENLDATRGPPVLSRNLLREVGRRDGLAWPHLELIRRHWPGKLVVKGVLAPEDAKMAHEIGADGVIVSNHGGRQLDYAIASLTALPDIVESAGDMIVMMDGGIRRGTDVMKAMALGARFVFVGRPFLFAAAVAAEAGVSHAVSVLSDELRRDLAMIGANRPEALSPAFLNSARDSDHVKKAQQT